MEPLIDSSWPYELYLDPKRCKFYYVNQETGETFWDAPVGVKFSRVYFDFLNMIIGIYNYI